MRSQLALECRSHGDVLFHNTLRCVLPAAAALVAEWFLQSR